MPIASALPKEATLSHTWLRYASDFMAPDSYWLMSLLAVASAAINGRILVNPGGEPSPLTNLYVVLVGPSGSCKGTPIRLAGRLLHEAVPEVPTLADEFSSSYIISHLAKETERTGMAKGFIRNEELASLIGGEEYRKENTRTLLKLFDGQATSRGTHKHGHEDIRNPYITLLSAIQPVGLESLDASFLSEGFLRRVLFIVANGPKFEYSAPMQSEVVFQMMVRAFAGNLGVAAFPPTYLRLTPEAKEANKAYITSTIVPRRKHATEREAQFLACVEEHTLKLGACVAALEGWLGGGGKDAFLDAPAVVAAQGLLEVLMPPMFKVYASLASTHHARLRAVIRRILATGGPMGHHALYRAVAETAGVSGKMVSEAVVDMEALGMLGKDAQGRMVLG